MKQLLKLTSTIALSAVIAACGSTPETVAELNENIPSWVLNPVIDDGLATAECVTSSGNMSIDKSQATALSRVSLAQQIGTKVQALDKTYQERIDTGGQVQVGSTFSSVSKQLSNQSLMGSRVIKTAYATIDGKNKLCVLTTLGSSSTKALFDNILKQSDRQVSIDQEEILYQEFKAHNAQKDLDTELNKQK